MSSCLFTGLALRSELDTQGRWFILWNKVTFSIGPPSF